MQRQLRPILITGLVLLTAVALFAASVHFKQQRIPIFTDTGLALTAEGALAGLGNENIGVFLDAKANATATCSNPSVNDGKDQQPAGQNPAPYTVSGVQFIPASTIDKNGNVGFKVMTDEPDRIIAGAPGCPNSSWTETLTDLNFTYALLTVEQPYNPATGTGTVVFQTCFQFSSYSEKTKVLSATQVSLAVCAAQGLTRS